MYTHEEYGWKAVDKGEYTRKCEDMDCEWPVECYAIIHAVMLEAYKEGTNGQCSSMSSSKLWSLRNSGLHGPYALSSIIWIN